MKRLLIYIAAVFMLVPSSCSFFEPIDIANENQPNINDLATPAEFYSLLRNGYNTWYNGSIAASPTIGFANAELFQAGTPGWGSGTMWFRPRQQLFNDDTPDPVIIINFGAWYNYYGSVGSAIKMSKMFEDPNFKITLGGVDYTNRAKAHAYLIQALLYGNIALLYDKAYLFTAEHDALTFDFAANTKTYQEVMDYALTQLDRAIELIETDAIDEDPASVVAGVTFNKALLLQFANSMGARFLASNARTQAENSQVDWNRVKSYAEKGLQADFKVAYDEGWRGKVMTRDVGSNYFAFYNMNWIRISQWLLNKMAPDDPYSVYPIPVTPGSDSFKDWPEIQNSPDSRLTKYFRYENMRNWFGSDRTERPGYGTFILSQYRYWRYYDIVERGQGMVDHFLKAENDTYLAEALIRTSGDRERIAQLINNSRVTLGDLPPALAAESYEALEDKLFYERYVECDLVWPQLGFFDRRRGKDQLIPGTARHFPIPGPELKMHGQALYTFGGVGNEM
ncbi:hypothetical protein GCM10007415_11140 [Parapedobacter pyrenivorans]|uniref:SusD family protein n=1 Tax=Parapedobacter pyrenivorans TaxID=1305674 RepID=A0A917HIC7_9SPHI|nr:hypothetical protein [Parapedobacter pyrenivorans]GGG80487.1 hypothetical protein GCM10007415_11140 [Parapedobacter pyrenivorans]